MKLLLDIGNTRLKWAMLERGVLLGADAVEHGVAGEAVNVMFERLANIRSTAPTGVVAASVASDQCGAQVAMAVHERWNLPVRFAVTQAQAGTVRNGYDDFHQLGVDRWLAIIAAVDQFAGPVCIVDAGTAITIDMVASDGVHAGGYIIPGLDLMHQSLSENTGHLRRLAGDVSYPLPAGSPAPGHGTGEAITSGVIAAVCGLLDGCISEAGGCGELIQVVVTGGDAERLMRHLKGGIHHRPQLVLEGLALYEFDQDADPIGGM